MSKGLKALEKIKGCLFWSDKGLNDIATIEKELKALEIIKNKNVHTRFIQMVNDKFTCEEYNKQFAREPSEDLTQEEFDLLKKVLL